MTEKDNMRSNGIEVFKDKKDFVNDYQEKVFKKIENILGAVFYIVSHSVLDNKTETLIRRINDKAVTLHELSFVPFSATTSTQPESVAAVLAAVREVRSVLHLAQAARCVEVAVVQALVAELDVVERTLLHHLVRPAFIFTPSAESGTITSTPAKPATNAQRRTRRSAIPAGDISTDAYLVYSQLNDRAERIKTVLEAKPQATVKDISEVITDVSEKTIQRELNSLIEKGQVVREGERRWSRYSVSK